MKKYVFMTGLLAMSLGFVACGDDPVNLNGGGDVTTIPEGTDDSRVTIEDNNIDVSSENVGNWMTYAQAVATLLAKDADELYTAWAEGYVLDGARKDAYMTTFKQQQSPYTSVNSCLEQIIDGCIDIANEVGTAKIGEPRDYWEKGQYTDAVYAVESWYSFHSIDDYSNNILSIRNSFNGSLDNREDSRSIAGYLRQHDNALYTEVKGKLDAAYNAVHGMTYPFRSHIGSQTVVTAMNACADLCEVLENRLKPYFNDVHNDDEALKAIVDGYVDNVVLPTYARLREKTVSLQTVVRALAASPSTDGFKLAADAWMEAREPWETSEAFLFGPVDEKGLDPNMDSWPLDVDAIKRVMESGRIEELINWSEGDDEEQVEAVQNVRGFHTLEFLLFKDGKARMY